MNIEYQIVYWRDIPAQVKVRQGRQRANRELGERFQLAIDRVAMLSGASSAEDYLEEWRSSAWTAIDPEAQFDHLDIAAEQVADQIEADYPAERLQSFIANRGYQP